MSKQRTHMRLERQTSTESFWPDQQAVINTSGIPDSVHEVLASEGQNLDSETRAYMELRFGHDFSQVRIHTDKRAEQSAQDVSARAYTVGSDIVFGQGLFAPATSQGQRLLAHELTHVVQQGGFAGKQPAQIGTPDSLLEQEANQIASTIALPLAGRVEVARGYASGQLQRQTADGNDQDDHPTPRAAPARATPQNATVTVQPPSAQQITGTQAQTLNQQHPPVNVQVSGSAPSAPQQQSGGTQQQTNASPAQQPAVTILPNQSWNAALDADSDPFQFKITYSMKNFDLLRLGIRGLEVDILDQPGLEVDLSRNPTHFGSFAGAQASANLFRLHIGRAVELALPQVGIGVDDQGLPIVPLGAEADIHVGPVDISTVISGHIDLQGDTHNVTPDTATVNLKFNF